MILFSYSIYSIYNIGNDIKKTNLKNTGIVFGRCIFEND